MSDDTSLRTYQPPASPQHIYNWYAHAQINYADLYMRLYIAYNAWYRTVTAVSNDREALTKLKKRFVIWDDFIHGATLSTMKVYVEKIVQYTSVYPLPANPYWKGALGSVDDWRGLIEYWYQVRCAVVHGVDISRKHVRLAYETLEQFMHEITYRMKRCFTEADRERLNEIANLALTNYAHTKQFKEAKRNLHEKYIASPDIWQVDMQRVNHI